MKKDLEAITNNVTFTYIIRKSYKTNNMSEVYSIEKQKQTEFYETVGSRIKLARNMQLLTQDDLAFIFGISRVSVTNIETGKQRLPLHLIVALCGLLAITVDELVPEYKHNVKSLLELKNHKVSIAVNKIEDNLTNNQKL